MLCSIFHEKLDPHSGSVQDTQSEGNGYWQIQLIGREIT